MVTEWKFFLRAAVCSACLAFPLFVVMCAGADRRDISGTRDGGTFGQKDDAIFTLRGEIYAVPTGTDMLPNFTWLKPMGVIYTDNLNIPARNFEDGFPGVTDRTEWFAIDYNGYFYIRKTGKYFFRLTSDDGSRLFIDDNQVINNDGGHPARIREGAVELAGGLHRIRVQYYQGPRYGVALVLEISETGDDYRVFRIPDYMPAKITTRGKRTEIVLCDDLLFGFNKTALKAEARRILDDVIRYYLKRERYQMLVVGGHTDNIGTDEQNMTVSTRRANNVRMYLISQGFDGRKIAAKGYGKTQPRYPNNSVRNRAANRRIEIILIR